MGDPFCMSGTRVVQILLAFVTMIFLAACGHEGAERDMARGVCQRAVQKKLEHEKVKAPALFYAEHVTFKNSWFKATVVTITGIVKASEVQHGYRCTAQDDSAMYAWHKIHVNWTD